MKTWYTQPKENRFSSFYYFVDVNEFNDEKRVLVRIRLEEGREKIAIYKADRYVGFSTNYYNADARRKFVISGNKIKFGETELSLDPAPDHTVYDFTSDNGINPNNEGHIGNVVTLNPKLPDNVTVDLLKTLARTCLKAGVSIVIAAPGEDLDLAARISQAIKKHEATS